MGQTESGSSRAGQPGDGHDTTRSSAGRDDGEWFESAPTSRLQWHPEARLLLNEALEKVPPHTRGLAQRQAEQQIEALAREWGAQEISAELVGLALGGMSSSMGDG